MWRLLAYLIDLVLAILVGKLLGRVFQTMFGTPPGPREGPANRSGPRPGVGRQETNGGRMARDPVCGMFVSTEVSCRLNQDGQTLHFCSQDCLNRYQKAEVKVHP